VNLYNDIDPKTCSWTKELINLGLIPPGNVVCKSIRDIQPDEIKEYTQVHLFNGISGWAFAAKLAGWPPERPAWFASAPCQPFSCAGRGGGTDDERHLWPELMRLIRACRPPVVFGEQVASAAVVGSVGKRTAKTTGPVWLDGISADLASENYACGAVVLGAHSVGAPHIRQRLYWVADAGRQCDERRGIAGVVEGPSRVAEGEDLDQTRRNDPLRERQRGGDADSDCGPAYGMAHPQCDGRRPDESGRGPEGRAADRGLGGMADVQQQGLEGHPGDGDHRDEPRRVGADSTGPTATSGGAGGVDNSAGSRRIGAQPESEGDPRDEARVRVSGAAGSTGRLGEPDGAGRVEGRSTPETTGHGSPAEPAGSWSDFTVLQCRDGKARRTQSSIFPLVDGLPKGVVRSRDPGAPITPDATAEARTMRLRGYGNAIVPPLAAEFIRAYLTCRK
jgi:DNA (cytosine-5)-methyltransferase 1